MSQKRKEIHSEGYEWMLKSTRAEKQTSEFITVIRESNLKKLKSTKTFGASIRLHNQFSLSKQILYLIFHLVVLLLSDVLACVVLCASKEPVIWITI